ncbi:MAG: metallophosphoesterase [Acidimicrobiia bacterium]
MIRVAQVTDTHVPARPDAPTVIEVLAAIEAGDPVVHLELVLADIAALEPAPDLVVGTGDLADAGDPAAYERWAEFFLDLGVPVQAMPGNHDLAEAHDATFARAGVGTPLTTRLGDWLLVFVRTGNTEWGEISPVHVAEVRSALAASDAPHVFVWIHHPPVGQHLPAHETLVRDDLRAALDGDPRVRGIAAGHVHVAAEHDLDGIPVWLTPSTYTGRPGPGYRVLDLHDDGRVTTEVRFVDTQFSFDDAQRDKLVGMAMERFAHEPEARRGAEAEARAEVEGWLAATREGRVARDSR